MTSFRGRTTAAASVRALAFVALVVLVVLAAGCHRAGPDTNRAPEPAGPVVRSVELRGVERFERDEFLAYLNLQPTRGLGGAKHYYIPGLEAIDARRVTQLYGAYGYFEAKVVRIEVQTYERPARERRRRRRVRRDSRRGEIDDDGGNRARVLIVVDEGLPTTVRHQTFTWSPATDGTSIDRAAIEARSQVAVGSTFETDALTRSAARMRDGLRAAGFAHAKVTEAANVRSDERWADVAFQVEPGAAAKVGRIEVEGLRAVPGDLVLRELEFARDKPFSPGLVRRIERAVYAMEVFAAVTVEEGPVRDDGTIDLAVRVHESKLQSIKLGVGIGFDPVRWEQRGKLRYRHESLFGRLVRMDLTLNAGYAELPTLYNPRQHGPIAGLDLQFRKKGLLERNLVWTESPSIELGIWDGYQFWGVRNQIGVARFFSRYFETRLSYTNRFTDFFNIAPTLDTSQSVLGVDFRDPYIVSYVGLEATVHLVDDLIQPRNGARLRFGYDVANRWFGSHFNFHRIPVELRGYYQPHPRVRLAARARVGFIIPYGDPRFAGTPIDMKWYLGGAYDVRGWPFRSISPRVEGPCEADGTCRSIPIGGNTEVLGSVEARVRVVADLWVAAFVDGGDVRAGIGEFVPAGWQATTGGGLRYDLSFATIRLDVGTRLTRDDLRFPVASKFFPGDENVALHIAIGEAF